MKFLTLAVGGPNPPGSQTLAGGAVTPGIVKMTGHRAAMPPASEARVTLLKDPDPFVDPITGWWHAFQGAGKQGADRPGVSLRSTPRLISLNPVGSRPRIQELTRRSADLLQLV